jgi:RHS repeat-associated protein
VFSDDLSITNTKGKVLQEDHYYPFGLSINALSSSAPLSKPNNFKYNGFEEQTDFDLGWYDYQAKFYDPQLGRFMQVDPAADLMRRHSPYNYAFDNPIRFIDPDGMMPEDKVEEDENSDPRPLASIVSSRTDESITVVGLTGFISFGGITLPTFKSTTLNLGSNVKSEHVTDESAQIIGENLIASGNESATITSAYRDPEDQARVMFDNLEKHGVESQKHFMLLQVIKL